MYIYIYTHIHIIITYLYLYLYVYMYIYIYIYTCGGCAVTALPDSRRSSPWDRCCGQYTSTIRLIPLLACFTERQTCLIIMIMMMIIINDSPWHLLHLCPRRVLCVETPFTQTPLYSIYGHFCIKNSCTWDSSRFPGPFLRNARRPRGLVAFGDQKSPQWR